jgi:hypothetical protein
MSIDIRVIPGSQSKEYPEIMMRYIAVWMLIVGTAAAQEVNARFTAGSTSFVDEDSINHTTMGGSARFYVSKRWAVEPEYLYMRTGSSHSDSVLWGNFTFTFRQPGKRVNPYFIGGPGVIYSKQSFFNSTFKNTEAAGGGGFGARVFLSDRVFIAPQFRFGIADGIFGEATGSIGFVLRK